MTSDPQELQDALFTEISTKVVVTPLGYNLFSLSYINSRWQVAQQMLQSVIKEYGLQSQGLSVVEGQNFLASYQTELQTAQRTAQAAVNAEAQYVAQHPALAASPAKQAVDPEYQQLDAARVQAQANVQSIQSAINLIQQSISATGGSASTLFQVIDFPQVQGSVSRTKDQPR